MQNLGALDEESFCFHCLPFLVAHGEQINGGRHYNASYLTYRCYVSIIWRSSHNPIYHVEKLVDRMKKDFLLMQQWQVYFLGFYPLRNMQFVRKPKIRLWCRLFLFCRIVNRV